MIRTLRSIFNGPLLVLVGIYVLAAVTVPTFTSMQNTELLLIQTAILACVTLGMTVTTVAGGIDLSVGSVVAVTTVTIATLLNAHLSPVFAALGGILLGGVWGAINGLFASKWTRQPVAATFPVWLIARGVALAISHEQKVDAPDTPLNTLLTSLPANRAWQLFPAGVWFVVGLGLVLFCVFRYVPWGRNIFYLGSNAKAAKLCGLPIDRLKIEIFIVSGLMAGLAGLLQFSRLTVGDPTVADGLEFSAIAAILVGGGSLSGGKGSVRGCLIGVLLMTIIKAWCIQRGYESSVQMILTGVILAAAFIAETLRTRKEAVA
jgi:ribose transport system permease protein